jgi:Dyp-type peroxidase family
MRQILSLDGGGVRGLITVRLLERLTETPGLERAFDSVYLIAGNSSGALIALALARARAAQVPMLPALRSIKEVFLSGADVFGARNPFPIGFVALSKYFTKHRRLQFEQSLQNVKLRELGTHVLITTFDLDNEGVSENDPHAARHWKPKVFHSFRRADQTEPQSDRRIPDRDRLARDVALYSTAAPVFFPTVDGYIDGGVFANNPSMCALAQLFDQRYEPSPKPPLSEVLLFSIGAGKNASYVEGLNKLWGLIPWAIKDFIGLTMDAGVGVADYQCRQMLGEENYHRLDVDFQPMVKFKLDATARLKEVLKIADEVPLTRHIDWLQRYWLPKPTPRPLHADPTSKHVLGITELACVMPLKTGFADAFETHTYATRARMVLRALHLFRQASREVVAVRVFPDVVDVIRSIQSFRLSFLPGNQQLLLNVTFDQPWEPYMRLVWRDLGPLIDLILVNCKGYETLASDKGYERFTQWVRQHQVEAELFYSSSPHTVDDVQYLETLEELVRKDGASPQFDTAAMKLRAQTPDEISAAAAVAHPREMVRQGLNVLAAFYRLRDVYLDGTSDGRYLTAAVLSSFKTFDPNQLPIKDFEEAEYERELAWLRELKRSAQGTQPQVRAPRPDEIQGGIVAPYVDVTHACLLFARIEDPERARDFLRGMLARESITFEGGRPREGPYINVAFTFQGLKRLGASPIELAAFPKEFREGMEARAGLLGDVRANHPENWQWPEWNWDVLDPGPIDTPPLLDRVRVKPSTIDVVIQLQDTEDHGANAYTWIDHPLNPTARALIGDPHDSGIRVMSAQPTLYYHRQVNGRRVVTEHFGFVDEISQPRPDAQLVNDRVKLGDLVLGYENGRDDSPFFDEHDVRAIPGRTRGSLLDNGSFLVVRKLEQHVDALTEAIARFLKSYSVPWTREDVLGRLMGRSPDGVPVTNPEATTNDFDYETDDGSRCPFDAHIRRANPRTQGVPRIARRAMSYGPLDDQDPAAERGMMFMAYNASLAEQFEVIQRWMTGGNSTRGYSGRPDPFLRVQQEGHKDLFLIPYQGHVLRFELDKPFVTLKWGLYLFAPSKTAIERLTSSPRPDATIFNAQVAAGEQIIESVRVDDEWSAILEDSTEISSGRTAAVSAAIRERHSGVLRTRGGSLVLVASEELANQVLLDDTAFSVSEYRARMARSFGEIYLGMDASQPDYARLSGLPNAAISRVDEELAFGLARQTTAKLLRDELAVERPHPVRLSLERLADQVLAQLSVEWFDVPDGRHVKHGGRPADPRMDQSVHCPFHFVAPSRYVFSSPRPRQPVIHAGEAVGRALRNSMNELTRERVTEGRWPASLPPIPRAVWEVCLDAKKEIDCDLFARMLVGVMEGILPTVYGNFLKVTHQWLSDEVTFWRVQQDLALARGTSDHQRAVSTVMPPLKRALQARPVPDVLYRTATAPCQLGDKWVQQGDRVVVLIGSVLQELAGRRVEDVYPMFGGNRDAELHPTHACPGYKMALGVLLGMFAALLEGGAFARTQTPLLVLLSEARLQEARIPAI